MGQRIKADGILGQNIRKWRNARGMTQEQLSSQLQLRGCDISRGTLAKIEAGIRHISAEEMNAIKAALNLSFDDLFLQ